MDLIQELKVYQRKSEKEVFFLFCFPEDMRQLMGLHACCQLEKSCFGISSSYCLTLDKLSLNHKQVKTSIQYTTIVPCASVSLCVISWIQMETFEDSKTSPHLDFQTSPRTWSKQNEVWSVSLSCDVSWVFVAGRLLSTDHIERWKSAYTG